jgi:hypothetical protein
MLLLADTIGTPSWLGPASFGVLATAVTAVLSRLIKGYDDKIAKLEQLIRDEEGLRQVRDHELSNEVNKIKLSHTTLKARFDAHMD